MEDLTVEEFARWLQPKIEQEQIDAKVLDLVKTLRINGKVFMQMTDDEIKTEFKEVVFGDRKKLSLIRDEIVNKSTKLKARTNSETNNLDKKTFEKSSLKNSTEGKTCQQSGAPDSKNSMDHHEQVAKCSNCTVEQQQHKIRYFLCGGGNKMDGDYYTLLLTSAIDADQTNLEEAFQLIGNIDWQVIFDFDDTETVYNYLEQNERFVKVTTFTDFSSAIAAENGAKGSKTTVADTNFVDGLSDFEKRWIFCNGNVESQQRRLTNSHWKREKSVGFREAVHFYKKYFPRKRSRLVIFVMSLDKVFIEASEEFLLQFEDQWIMVAGSKELGEIWINKMQERDMQVERERCLHDCFLADVNQAVINVVDGENIFLTDCIINFKSELVIPKRKRREFGNLDIVSFSECRTIEAESDAKQLNESEAEAFYRGRRATWWNFYFSGHVCKRDKLEDLKMEMKESLSKERFDDDNIDTVSLYHQPGAGGTTLAMHLLWDLHLEGLICCFVKRITKKTSSQILGLYELGESENGNPQPIIAVVDNEEDKLYDLVHNIRASCLSNGVEKLICILLVCKRREAFCEDIKDIYIERKLSNEERQFFIQKYEEWENKGLNKEDSLLGLNIMKEDFNECYIKNTVSKLVSRVTDDHQRYVLKYTALLNCHDLCFRGIPISCFDPLSTESHQRGQNLTVFQTDCPEVWKNELEPLVVFVTNSRFSGKHKCIRICISFVCKYILDIFCQNCSQADLMDCFLESQMFQGKYSDVNFRELTNIVKDIMKKRGMDNNGTKHKFSSFIRQLIENQEIDRAVQCVEVVYERFRDAFIAQQIARIFIAFDDLDRAEVWAKIAVNRQPDNSYLWDTYGHVYKKRLIKIKTSDVTMNHRTLPRAISYAFVGYTMFKKEQELSRDESVEIPNTSGLFGQMDIVWRLSMILKQIPCLAPKDELRRVLVAEKPLPVELSQIPDEHIKWLRTLQDESYACLAEAEHWKMVHSDSRFSFFNLPAKYYLSEENIYQFIDKMNNIFCDDTLDDVEPLKTGFNKRQRHIRALGGHSLYSVINRCGQGSHGKMTALRIFELATLNIKEKQTREWHAYDLTMALASALTLISGHHDAFPKEEYKNLLDWSAALFKKPEAGKPRWDRFISMDPFVFLLALHWPTNDRKSHHSLCKLEDLKKAMTLARGTFEKLQGKPAVNHISRRNEPLLFLTNSSVISRERLKVISGLKSDRRTAKLVRSDAARDCLYRCQGILKKDGEEVSTTLTCDKSNSKMKLTVPLFIKENRDYLYNKKVHFALGIGLGGPVACAVDLVGPKVRHLKKKSADASHSLGEAPLCSENPDGKD